MSTLETLVDELGSSRTRRKAIRALGELGNPAAAHPLMQLLNQDEHGELSEEIWQAVVALGDGVIPAALAIFEGNDRVLKTFAADLLGHFRATSAVEPMIQYLAERRTFIRSQTLRRLQTGTLPDPAEFAQVDIISHVLYALAQIRDSRAEAMMMSLFVDGDGMFDMPLLECLAKLPPSASLVAWFSACLQHPHLQIAHKGALYLKRSNSPLAIEALMGLLKDECYLLRLEAIDGLGMLGDERALNALYQKMAGQLNIQMGERGGEIEMDSHQLIELATARLLKMETTLTRQAADEALQEMGVGSAVAALHENELTQRAIRQLENRLAVM